MPIVHLKDLTYKRLREALTYDKDTGIFKWRISTGPRMKPGEIAGQTPNTKGYRQIKLDAVKYKAHRLAWFYVYKRWPADQIDHINEDKSDNRICNLREAAQWQNRANTGACKVNTSGFKCVSFRHGKWTARISKDGKRINLGCYKTPEKAHKVYVAASKKLHKEFSRYK